MTQDKFLDLFELVFTTAIFIFESQFYEQADGMVIG